MVSLSCETEGVEIWYTTGGYTPHKNDSHSTKYESPIAIIPNSLGQTSVWINAIAYKDDMYSIIMEEEYTIVAPSAPVANPPAGQVINGTEVSLSATPEWAEIWYTTNGSIPAQYGENSAKYESPITISAATTIKAIAYGQDMRNPSEMLEASYTAAGLAVTFNPAGGGWGDDTDNKTIIVEDRNDTLVRPINPSRKFHIFNGWYTQQKGGEEVNFPVAVFVNTIIYAQWTIIPPTNISDISEYLAAQTGTVANPAPLPIHIDLGTMTQANSGWQQLLAALGAANKYVDLDLSDCTMNGTEFNPVYNVATGKDKIVSLVLPDVAESTASGNRDQPVFSSFTALTTLSGASITVVGDYAFSYAGTPLKSVSLPAATTIGEGAFTNCASLLSVSLPAAAYIGESAFLDCISLSSVSLPIAAYIGESAFENCISLASVSLPAATEVGESAFENCISLASVSLPIATSIGWYAFRDCTSLVSVSFPALASVYGSAFSGCTSLVSFNLIGIGPLSTIENGKALVRDDTTDTTLVSYPAASGSVTLTAITTIGAYAFSGCTSLASVSLPAVTSIGDYAFSSTGRQALTITMGPIAPSLGGQIFRDVTAAKNVTVKVPFDADDGYGTSPTDTTTDNWGNKFRSDSGSVNIRINLTIEYMEED
jgi:hypothetical protein